jgi:LuxR family transcriptional regulator, maltose regulon positive regulatory protein
MPAETLLRTKLYAPPPRRDLVARPRLLAKLGQAISPEMPLTLVSAPAGFGKTTLVSEWLAARAQTEPEPAMPAAWLTLDDSDNDPIRFWRYVDAALQTLDPRLGESIRPALYAPQPPPFKLILTGLINDIVTVGLPFIWVLDDYHHIESEAVHESVNFLLDHLPPLAHLVIITRSDPPLQLARRRGQRALCEVRAADLRFTVDEAGELINAVMRLGLGPDDIAALEKRTEGWIVGLQMAAISLQDVADPHAFVAAFRGDDRYVADYLLEEVLQRQPVEFQHFLLQTSILDRLSGSLCDAVTGRSDSRAVLNTLERANLFVIPLDSRREWFRYHQLFASLLRQRLLDTAGAEASRDLQRRAGQWYAAHGQAVAAVESALACEDLEQAASLIEQSDVALFMGSEISTLVKWAKAMPAAVIAARPRLNVMAAWATHATGQAQACEHFIQMMEHTTGLSLAEFLADPSAVARLSAMQRSVLLEGAVISTSLAVSRLQLEHAFTMGQRVVPYLVPGSPEAPFAFNPPDRLLAPQLFALGLAYTLRGDLAQAETLLSRAEAEGLRTGNLHILAVTRGHLGEIQMMQGHLRQAQATFERSLQLAQAYPPRSSAFWGMASVGLGNLAYERNDLAAAAAHLQTGLELGKLMNVWECLLPGCRGLALLHQARGEGKQALAVLDELLELAAATTPLVLPAVEEYRALLNLRQGNLAAASRWLAAFQAQPPREDRAQWNQEALIAARIWLAQGQGADAYAEAQLRQWLPEAEAANRGGQLIEILILLALACQAQGQPEAAQRYLLRALALAEPEGYVRLFVDEGEPLRRLLLGGRGRLDSAQTALIAYIDRLLAAFAAPLAGPEHPKASLAKPHPLPEALSERELEVLSLMAAGHSNQEIADRLFISLTTVKSHATNIFGKLSVSNRTQAVAQARSLGLLAGN